MTQPKRLIFTITSGRSGTAYLAHLLSGLPDIWAGHEPPPYFHSQLPAARRDPAAARKFLTETKWPFIASLPESTYIEISHYAGKGFIDPMLQLGLAPDLILLGRDPRKVASSFFLIGVAKKMKKSDEFRTHMVAPDEPNFLPAEGWQAWHEYQFYYWYALETHFRGLHYARLITERGGKTFETSLDILKTDGGYKRLLAWAGVSENMACARVADQAFRERIINDKSESKRRKNRDRELAALDLDGLEAGVRQACGFPEVLERVC